MRLLILSGRILGDPETQNSAAGKPFTRARIECPWMNYNGEKGTSKTKLVAFGAMAARLHELRDGTKVTVHGRPEVEAWQHRDPVVRFRRYLENRDLWDAAEETTFLAGIADRVNEAIAVAEAASHPAAETLIRDVFADIPESLRRHYDETISESGIVDVDGHFPL